MKVGEDVRRSEMNYRGLKKKLQSIAAGGGGGCSVVALAIVGMSLLLSMITRCGVVLRECCIVVKV